MKFDNLNLTAGSFRGLVVPEKDVSIPGQPAKGSLLMTARGFEVALDSGFDLLYDTRELLYAFDRHVFTTGNTTGSYGPFLSTLKAAYAHAEFAQDTRFFNVIERGIQEWTVPASGYYRITAIGGGRAQFYSNSSLYRDARIATTGEFYLSVGDVLRMICGQIGKSHGTNFGGAGGSFVVSNELGLLLVSGGAGACGYADPWIPLLEDGDERGGRYGNNATSYKSDTVLGKAGTTERLGINFDTMYGSGGASYDTSAESHQVTVSSVYVTGAKSFLEGGTGALGTSMRFFAAGGFGGGGATSNSLTYSSYMGYGGGGGYSGGHGRLSTSSSQKAGDGGCFIAPFARSPLKALTTPSGTIRHGTIEIQSLVPVN